MRRSPDGIHLLGAHRPRKFARPSRSGRGHPIDVAKRWVFGSTRVPAECSRTNRRESRKRVANTTRTGQVIKGRVSRHDLVAPVLAPTIDIMQKPTPLHQAAIIVGISVTIRLRGTVHASGKSNSRDGSSLRAGNLSSGAMERTVVWIRHIDQPL